MWHSGVNVGMAAARDGRGSDDSWTSPDSARRNWDGGGAGSASGTGRMRRVRGTGCGGRRGWWEHSRSGRVSGRAM